MIEWSLVIDEGVAVWTATNGERRVRIYDYGHTVLLDRFEAHEPVGLSEYTTASMRTVKDYATWWLNGGVS